MSNRKKKKFTGNPPPVSPGEKQRHARVNIKAAQLPGSALKVLHFISALAATKDSNEFEWILIQIPTEYAHLRIAWPAVKTIATGVKLSVRAVQYALKVLEKEEYLFRVLREDDTTIYIVANYS